MKKAGLIAGLAVAFFLLLLPAPPSAPPPAAGPAADDRVAVEALRQWIVDGAADYLLLDVRPAAAFQEDAIKTAVSMPAATLDAAAIRALPRHRRLVLYADDTDAAVAAWQAVRRHRPDVYLLDGGRAAWAARVLHPQAPAPEAPEAAWQAYREDLAVAAYLVGDTVQAPVERVRTVRPVLRPRPSAAVGEGC